MKSPASSSRTRGFSLLELLIVVFIMALVAKFVVPAVGDLVRGTPLTMSSQIISGQLELARQSAITRNRPIEVRMLKFADPEQPGESGTDATKWSFRGLQLMEILDSGAAVALDQPRLFQSPAIIYNKPAYSSMLDTANTTVALQVKELAADNSSDPKLPRGIDYNYHYVSFRFLPNGGTTLSPTGIWFVTLLTKQDATVADSSGSAPANFFTVQLDPVSGGLRTFRPGVQ